LKSSRASRIWLAVALALPALIAQTQAQAQTQGGPSSEEDELTMVYGDADSVSIATGNLQTLRRAPAVASVVTAADIAAMGATDLDHVLETVAGLHISRSPNSYTPLYIMRGVFSQYAPQVLVLQNGVPVTTLYIGNKGNVWGTFPVEQISRIEVIRGPGSALYGSDAFSGVINIITKGPAEAAGTEVGVRFGSFQSRDAGVQHGGKLGPIEIAAYLRTGTTDGQHRTLEADAQTRNDTLLGTHASLAPGGVNTGGDALDLNLEAGYGQWRARFGYKLRDRQGSGAGIASALDLVGVGRSERINTSLGWADAQFSRNWGLGASISTQSYAQELDGYILLPPGTRFPTGLFPNGMIGIPETWERSTRLTAYADYSGFADHHVRVGIGHDDLDLYRTRERRNFTYTANGTPVPLPGLADFSDSNPFMRPHKRRIDYLYAQDEWRLATDWTLTAGVRHDRYSDFGGTTNPRFALVWDATFDLTAKLLYGRAFRAPSFNEAYSLANPVARGNANLKPETDRTLEAAFSWQAQADAQINLTLYRYEMGNIIRLVPNVMAGTGSTFANQGDQTGHGMELEGNWNVNRELRLVGNYAWQRSVDEATQKDAGYAPRHHLFARADWQFGGNIGGNYTLSPQLNWVAGRQRAAGDLRKPIADYRSFDLTLSTRRGKNQWNFSAAVRNIFDADAREPTLAPGLALPFDLPLAGRAFSVQASYKL
jgi:iron complex outermembrane receptor protein